MSDKILKEVHDDFERFLDSEERCFYNKHFKTITEELMKISLKPKEQIICTNEFQFS